MSFNPAQFKMSKWDMDTLKHQNPYIHHKIMNIKPIREFLNLSKINVPKSTQEIKTRLFLNLSFFQSNYLIILGIVSMILLFQNLVLLVALVVLIGGFIALQTYEIDEISIGTFHTRINKSYLYIALLVTTLPIILYSSPISTLISIFTITSAIVVTHALLIDNQPETSFNESVV